MMTGRTMIKRRALAVFASAAVLILGLAGDACADERDLSLTVTRQYEGTLAASAPVPVVITASNRGPAAVGVVAWSDDVGATRVEIPIDLPTGSSKAFVAAVSRPPWGSTYVTLETNRGTLNSQVSTTNQEESTSGVLMIAEHSGDLTFLTKQKTKGQYGESIGTAVAYVRPAAAFLREADYGPVGTVVLGEGAERMSAAAFRALREYVLRGGHLVLLGGASAPVLTNPNLASLVPFTSLTSREIAVDGRPVSAQIPTPRPGATKLPNVPVPVIREGCGLGRVTYVATNPLEGTPLPSRQRILSVAVDIVRSTQLARSAVSSGPNLIPFSEGGGETNDPFALEIPPTATIFTVLGLYFLVVMPVNFLILRAMKRLEWAWFSSPAIALLFAGLLFRNAGSLYSAREGTATHAIVVAAGGDPRATVLGSARMFFPQASSQPLTVENATFLLGKIESEYNPYYGSSSQLKPIPISFRPDPVVTGYDTSALEFRDLSFRQRLDLGGGIRLRREGKGYSVVNGSRLALHNVRILDGTTSALRSSTGPDLPPGERGQLEPPKGDASGDPLAVFARGRVILTARVEGPRLGPLVGTPVPSRTSTTLVLSEGG